MIGTNQSGKMIKRTIKVDDNNPDPKAQAKVVGKEFDGFAHRTAKKIPDQSSRISSFPIDTHASWTRRQAKLVPSMQVMQVYFFTNSSFFLKCYLSILLFFWKYTIVL